MKSIFEKLIAIFSRKPEPMIKKVLICVGHSRMGDKGAVSRGNVSEWAYNQNVAEKLREKLTERSVSSRVISETPFKSYYKSCAYLAEQSWGYDCVIELHFNSHTPNANGFEYLYCAGSQKGKKLAESFRKIHSEVVPGQKDRGIKAISRGGRGYRFLSKTKPPAVILEPFFGSNAKEWVLFDGMESELAQIYCDALVNYLA